MYTCEMLVKSSGISGALGEAGRSSTALSRRKDRSLSVTHRRSCIVIGRTFDFDVANTYSQVKKL